MDKTGRNIIIAAAVIIILALTAWMIWKIPYVYGIADKVQYTQSTESFPIPLTGFAPAADNIQAAEEEELVYIQLSWAQWEPQQGVYDIEGLEKRNHINQWKKEGKHAVLRFVCDIPGTENHMDIPDWLYQETHDGMFYDIEYGKGYCPDYENRYFIEQHEKAIQALAEYCNQDMFIAYVELGSLGHWGEWHTLYTDDLPVMPDEEICWEYVLAYSDNFHNARLLMRRNYTIAAEGELGLYNDMTGDSEATAEWINWIKNGGSYQAEENVISYTPVPDFWKKAPVGGELTSGIPMEELLGKKIEETVSMVKETHMTFLGPNCPTGELRRTEAAEKIKKELGYRLWISQAQMKYHMFSQKMDIEFVWENSGNAPLYWDLPIRLYIRDDKGKSIYWEDVNLNLTRLYPGEKMKTRTTIPFSMEYRNGYSVGIGIVDLDTGEPDLRLALEKVEYQDGINWIYTWKG